MKIDKTFLEVDKRPIASVATSADSVSDYDDADYL